MGAVVGMCAWRADAIESVVAAWNEARTCPQCIAPPECPAPSPPVPTAPDPCVSLTSETFLKLEPNVKDYYNKRLEPVPDAFTAQECNWIIQNSKASTVAPDTALVFPRTSKSWGWLYDRIHTKVLERNRELWHFPIAVDFRSELVEDILLVVKTNESAVVPGWAPDIGHVGPTGKRVLSAIVVLNKDYEGGEIETLPDQTEKPFALEPDQGLLWLVRSFMLRKQQAVTKGRQYVLYYWLRRY